MTDLEKIAQDEAAQKENAEKVHAAASASPQVVFLPIGISAIDALEILWTIAQRDNHPTIEKMAAAIKARASGKA